MNRTKHQNHKRSRQQIGSPFESALDLVTMVRLALQNRRVGGYLLRRGQARWCMVFGFACQGIHNTLSEDQMLEALAHLESGLKELPKGERLTLHMGLFAGDTKRQQELVTLANSSTAPALKLLLTAERARLQELARQGLRKPVWLRLYCTYSFQNDTDQIRDPIGKVLHVLERGLQTISGEIGAYHNRRLATMLHAAFNEGFLRWEQLLANKMGLTVSPLDEQQLWETLWSRLNHTPAIPIPQCLILDAQGLREEITSRIHAATHLSRDGVPQANPAWVKVKERYVGVLSWLDKPEGWASPEAQLRHLWERLSRDDVTDIECIVQLTHADERLTRATVEMLSRQASHASLRAAEQNLEDVGAAHRIEETLAAQQAMVGGAKPIYAAVVFLIHRKSRAALSLACRQFESYFARPAWIARETQVAWVLWRQTLPIVLDPLAIIGRAFNRRLLYLTSEVPGLLPLVTVKSCDHQGLELLSDEGGVPVFLDLFSTHRNLGIFGTTRSGKSVLVSGILTQALARGMPVVAMDFPKPDGSSTFSEYTCFVGGAYFDISQESNNLFELPDLRGLAPELREKRLAEFKGFLEQALLAMVLGAKRDQELPVSPELIESILKLALDAFFQAAEILQRYDEALAAGLGSQAWSRTPTLVDFLAFCKPDALNLSQVGDRSQEVLQFIEVRLRGWLSSGVGGAVSKPSSFHNDASLLVFALTNLSSNNEAAVLAISAYAALLRRALSCEASLFFIDEAPILFEFPQIARLIGRVFANGAKAGIRVILTAQDPDTIERSVSSTQIFQNMNARLIGRIQPAAVPSFERIFRYPQEIVSRCARESFLPKRQGIYSQWLLDDNGSYTVCRYYPALLLLALTANNPDEQAARQRVWRCYADAPFVALAEFAKLLKQSIQAGIPLKQVVDQWERNWHPEQTVSLPPKEDPRNLVTLQPRRKSLPPLKP